MTNPMIPFEKDASFWEARGMHAMEQKAFARAVMLYRKALSVAPDVSHLHLRYANALQALGCYEKSNAHVLEAASLDPVRRAPFLIMCGNFVKLGDQQRLMDTCGYLFAGSQDPNDLKLQKLFGLTPDQGGEDWRAVRHQRYLHYATSALSQKDCKTAQKWMDKAKCTVMPTLKSAHRLCEIWLAGLQKEKILMKSELQEMRMELKYDLDLMLLAARACHAQQKSEIAGALLLRAGACGELKEEASIMQAAMDCGFPNIAKAVAQKYLKDNPQRISSCYNLAKLLFMEKKSKEAKGYVNRCLEIGGMDPYVRLLCTSQTMRKANALPLYGEKRMKDFKSLFTPLEEAHAKGIAVLADRLSSDADLREYFFLAMQYDQNPYTRCLPKVIGQMTQQRASQMLRMILLEASEKNDVTRYAGKTLCQLFQSPPFGASFEDCLVSYDPTAPVLKPKPSLRMLLMDRYWKRMQRRKDAKAVTFAYWLLTQMDDEERLEAMANKEGVWQRAFDQVWAEGQGLLTKNHASMVRGEKQREKFAAYYQKLHLMHQEYRRNV